MRRLAVVVLLSIAVAAAADKDKARFAPRAASAYAGHQKMDQLTIAAVPFLTDEQTEPAFGKLNPNHYGVLPVLVVIENGTGKAIRLDLETRFIDPDNRHVEATPATEIITLGGVARAPKIPGQSPLPFPTRKKKNPLNTWEIPGRAFAARMIPPGDSVSGFFYFQTEYKQGSRLYLNGLKDAATGKDYFYFEVPVEKQ